MKLTLRQAAEKRGTTKEAVRALIVRKVLPATQEMLPTKQFIWWVEEADLDLIRRPGAPRKQEKGAKKR